MSNFAIAFFILQGTAIGLENSRNIALNGKVTTSSVDHGGIPEKAVDGNRDPIYEHGSCTHTAYNQDNPWWLLDLGSLSEVYSISVTNRGFCCPDRLQNFTIQMSQTLAEDHMSLLDPSLCFHYHPGPMAAGATVNFACSSPVYVRYVKIQIHMLSAILTLCEVEVFGSKPALSGHLPCTGYRSFPGRKSAAMVLKEISVSAIIRCAMECHRTDHCYSINIKQQGDVWICQLLEDTWSPMGRDGSKIIDESGWTFMYFQG